ncbi:hypothetical protein [Hyunsoonleella aestuarii]|uniref:Uncharacterized protein n=1 Tax=Hyunsoonleella aestuarii TaxID=912802 RepID=A0ABP8ED54_9FLAO|nr:hypothetical protein [Hyunsoonleella aestuarii]
MKKIGSIILGFIIGAFVTYYFCPRTVSEVKEAKIIKPSGVISIAEADSLNNNWTKFRKVAVDSAAKKQGRNKDNRWAAWSLDDIENYISYAKNQSDSLGYDMTGIRIYLGVYGKNAGQTKKNLTTMFMVPTGKKSVSQASSLIFQSRRDNIPIDPLNEGQGGDSSYP